MAAQDDSDGLSSTFPDAPGYLWKDFTAENVERIDELRQAHAETTGERITAATRLAGLPDPLAHLQAPPEPQDGLYRLFGARYSLQDALPTLEEQGIQRLGPDGSGPTPSKPDRKRIDEAFELKKLAKSILLNFLELTGVYAVNPADAEAKVADLRTLFINMHHTINEWRPHQTREALISLMQTQLERTQAETKALREVTESARRVLESLGSIELAAAAATATSTSAADEDGGTTKAAVEPRNPTGTWTTLDDKFD